MFDKTIATINIPEDVKIFRKIKYDKMISLEQERNMRDPFMGIAESVGCMRGLIAAT